jgi:hypothetical protein
VRVFLTLAPLTWATLGCDVTEGLVLGYGTISTPAVDSGSPANDDDDATTPPDLSIDAGNAPPSSDASTPDSSDDDAGSAPPSFASVCYPTVTYDNLDDTGRGQLFDDVVADPEALLRQISALSCSLLYESPDDVKVAEEFHLIVEDFAGIASTNGSGQIRVSSSYLATTVQNGGDLAEEVRGLLHFAVGINYQYDDTGTVPVWLMTGTADYIRLKGGHLDPAGANAGGSWTDGYQTTAYFLDYLSQTSPDLVRTLNAVRGPGAAGYADQVFVDVTGDTVGTLWSNYQASL